MVRWSVGDGKGVLDRLVRRKVMLSGKRLDADGVGYFLRVGNVGLGDGLVEGGFGRTSWLVGSLLLVLDGAFSSFGCA